MSTIPGVTARHTIITDVCRKNRGEGAAFDEAVARMKEEYYTVCDAWRVGHGAKLHLVLTLERPPLPSVERQQGEKEGA